MSLSPIAICSRALLKIGAQPIHSFNDDTAEAALAQAFFLPTCEALLSAYPWRFATAQAPLPRLSAAPLAEYPYAFQLPNDCLRVLSVGSGNDSRGLRYRRIGNTLHCAADTIAIDYIFYDENGYAPAYFEQALIARLAAEFCLPLTENTSRAESLYRIAENEFDRAKRIDAQQDTPRALDDFNLLSVR